MRDDHELSLEAAIRDADHRQRRLAGDDLGCAVRRRAAYRQRKRRRAMIGVGLVTLAFVSLRLATTADDQEVAIAPGQGEDAAVVDGPSGNEAFSNGAEMTLAELERRCEELDRKLALLSQERRLIDRWREEELLPVILQRIEDVQQENRAASAWLMLLEDGTTAGTALDVRDELNRLVALYPGTRAAQQARVLLTP
ncbi:MAG: hypothetical protein AAF961_11875 [Planctomycetota bacterium]